MTDDSFSRRLSALANRRREEPVPAPVFVPEPAPEPAEMSEMPVAESMASARAEEMFAAAPAVESPPARPVAPMVEAGPEPQAFERPVVSAPPIAPEFPSETFVVEPEAPVAQDETDNPSSDKAPALEQDEMEMLRARLAARKSEIVAPAADSKVDVLAAPEAEETPLAMPPEIAPAAFEALKPEALEPAAPETAAPETAAPVAEAPVEFMPLEPAPEPTGEIAAPAPVASQPSFEPSLEAQPVAEAAPQPEPVVEATPAPAPAPAPRAPEPELPPGVLMSFIPRDRSQDEQREFDPNAPRNRSAGHIISCSGDHALVKADTSCFDTVSGEQWAVGRLLSIRVDEFSRIVALVHHVETPMESYDPEAEASLLLLHVELQGAVIDKPDGSSKFAKGIDAYPPIGSICHQIRSSDLAAIYAAGGDTVAEIGHLSQDADVPAFVDIEDMISKHFAVLGSTGCGKSCSVSLLLHASQQIMPDLRVLILDPHNEYSCAFPDCTTITIDDLDLPFWMFQLDEYVECLFRGKPVIQEEVDALREFIPKAKIRFREGEGQVSIRAGSSGMNPNNSLTADTPVPYRISDVLGCLEEELGLLDSKMEKSILKSLKNRIETHATDPRFAFMFRHRTITDVAGDVVGKLFALAPDTKGLTTVLQMAGMPAEVVNSCASVLCRMAFELSIAAKGGMKILVVCEEAHRYVPRDAAAAFGPTRQAIARIAKEGRKYGCFMSIVSQRPAELDPTILSQCCTVFSLRLSNDSDQDIIRKSISTGSESAIKFLSSIGNREAIAFGEGFSTPMRMKFANLPVKWLPGQDSDVFGRMGSERKALELGPVLTAWRGGAH